MATGREATHVRTDLRDHDLGRSPLDTRDAQQHLDLRRERLQRSSSRR